MTADEFNKLSNYEKLEIIGSIPQPPVEITRLNTGAARFFVHSESGKRHRIFGNDITWCKADGIRDDHYIIKLDSIVLAVEKGDESLDIRAEW